MPNAVQTSEPASAGTRTGITYSGEDLRCVALPLGGIGTGQIALCGDGSLRQWQMVNQINHLGFVPDSFFALRASSHEPPLDVIRILQSRDVLDFPDNAAPLVNDHVIPPSLRQLLEQFPGVERTTFSASYPFARIVYEDDQLPLEMELEAWSPFMPLNEEESGLPAIIFSFTFRNHVSAPVHGCLGAALQNAVGWDGITPITGHRCPLFGGNTNRLLKEREYLAIVMENPSLPDDHPGWGQMALAALNATARPIERWTEPAQFIEALMGFHLDGQLNGATSGVDGATWMAQRQYRNAAFLPVGPSPRGETWNGGFLAPFRLRPGETATITFVFAWYFPNRYVNFDQFGPRREYGKSRFWLGNAYGTRFPDVEHVIDHVVEHRASLRDASTQWASIMADTTFPEWMNEMLAAQAVPLRSPTCFRMADGKFFGFEGCLGASTTMWNGAYGGSCPLNCTHVWNYEQALAHLFPRLEQTMRETELEVMQAPEGYIPHRAYMPLYLPQLWDVPVGGPDSPALDGMLGTVLKVYREVRQGAGLDWLYRLWPSVTRLLTYISNHWDGDGDGVLEGKQPTTYDISFYGANLFIGALWLAALRAAEEMALLLGESDLVHDLRERFECGSARYDQLLWNGEYYIQRLQPGDPISYQYGEGCLSDQLLGQWWAHLLDLGYLLPRDHVRTALQSIVRYNFRQGFHDFKHGYRVFADADDSGLLVCTWPHGGRPEVPVDYADEVWTGIEYQVGAHCIMEGLVDEGCGIVEALRARYSGTRRNPFNEIECGDHYARSLAGWSVLNAMTGFRYNALDDSLRFAPAMSASNFRAPFVTGTGWGTYDQSGHPWSRIALSCAYGEIRIRRLILPEAPSGRLTVSTDVGDIFPRISHDEDILCLEWDEPLLLGLGAILQLAAGAD